MNHHDAEFSDVIVVLADESNLKIDDAVAKLIELGLTVTEIDNENGVVEGTVESIKIHAIKTLEFVKYVRDVFTYTADFPKGDPRDLDADEGDVDDVDDAGR